MTQAAPRAPLQTVFSLDTQTPRYKWFVASTILLACAAQIFAGTSLNLTIPRLMLTFGTDLATTQWVATGFLVSRTLMIPLLGWLSSMLGNRNLFVAVLVGYVITLLGCGLSTNLTMLVVFRVLQGAVLGPMEGLTAVILVQTFPPLQRGLAIGLRSIGWALGELLFYTVGGYLFEHFSWRLLFFLGMPFALSAALLGWLVLPKHPKVQNPTVDYPGIFMLGSFLVPLLLVIGFGRNSETATSTLMLLGLTGLLGGILFVIHELRTAFPAVNLRLFRQPTFCLLCGTGFFSSMGIFGALFMVPIFLQQVLGLTPWQSSLLLLPAIPVAALSGLVAGRLSDRFPPSFVAIGGLLSMIAIFWAFASVTALTSVAVLLSYLILYRAFLDTVGIPITSLTLQTLPADEAHMGQGLLGVLRSIGASLGVTVTSVFFERRRVHHQSQAYSLYDQTSATHESTLQEIQQGLYDAGLSGTIGDQEALDTIRQQIDIDAIASGFQESFLFVSICFVLAMIPILCLLSRRLRAPAPVA